MELTVGGGTKTFAWQQADWGDEALAEVGAMDPYIVWAEATRFEFNAQNGTVRVAIELADASEGQGFLKGPGTWLTISMRYRNGLAAGICRFFTAKVPVQRLDEVSRLVRCLKPGFITLDSAAERGQGDALPIQDLNSDAMRPAAVARLRRMWEHRRTGTVLGLEPLGALRLPRASRATLSELAPQPLIAVIDAGCAFAHTAFQRPGSDKGPQRTRVLALWDQARGEDLQARRESAAVWPWRQPATMSYGREATAERLDALIASVRAAFPGLAQARREEACYVAAEMPELLEPSSHGTAVLGLAAGWPHAHAAPGDARDAAAKAEIVFVQLPMQAVEDLSGGWVTPYVLDGIEYVLDLAETLARPVVINISIGSLAGPHDGQSLLERALDDYAARPGVTIVMAAGNAGDKLGHARATIPAGQTPGAELQWALPPDDPTQSFLELWYPRPASGVTPGIDVEHPAITPVLGNRRRAVPLKAKADPGKTIGMLVHAPHAAEGLHAGRVLLALAPTAGDAGAALAPAGVWTVRVNNPGPAPLEVHAWVERDETRATALGGRADMVLLAEAASAFKIEPACTLTAQTCGTGPVVVGFYTQGAAPRVAPAAEPESGRGPARAGMRQAVDVLAPGDERVEGLDRGLAVLANTSDQGRAAGNRAPAIRLRGTSLAAPWVARQIFNALAADRTLDSRQKLVDRLKTDAKSPGRPTRGALFWS